MNFEHLIEINADPLPGVAPMTRAQLWQGLVIRAEKPQLTVFGLDACDILERGEGYLRREQHFGPLRVRDTVSFVALQSVIYETEPGENLPAGRLAMRIEEPAPGRLFVRFTYADLGAPPEVPVDAAYGEYVKQAYVQADIDTVTTIRELIRSGLIAAGEA